MAKVMITLNGTKIYYDEHSRTHRIGGPAVIYPDGGKVWRVNDIRHNEKAPAILYRVGGVAWYTNDRIIRLDGPALDYPNGVKRWYNNGNLIWPRL